MKKPIGIALTIGGILAEIILFHLRQAAIEINQSYSHIGSTALLMDDPYFLISGFAPWILFALMISTAYIIAIGLTMLFPEGRVRT